MNILNNVCYQHNVDHVIFSIIIMIYQHRSYKYLIKNHKFQKFMALHYDIFSNRNPNRFITFLNLFYYISFFAKLREFAFCKNAAKRRSIRFQTINYRIQYDEKTFIAGIFLRVSLIHSLKVVKLKFCKTVYLSVILYI